MKRFTSTMLTFVALLAATLCGPLSPVHAQTARAPFSQPWYFAADYNFRIASQTANTFLWSPRGICTATASGTQFNPFKVGTTVLIVDVTAANSEVVTPTAVTATSNACGFAATALNNHYSFSVTSATGGLQEALNQLAVSNASKPGPIYLDRNWYSAASSIPGKTPAGIITAAAGNAKAFLVDLTTIPATYYSWSGTAYTAVLYSAH